MKVRRRVALYALNVLVGMFAGAYLILNSHSWFTWTATFLGVLIGFGLFP